MVPLVLALMLLQPAAPPAARVEEGIRLVDQGDFEAAVTTLRAAAAAIAGDPARSVERARAYLYLGVAHLALGQGAEAHTALVSALRDDPRLRVTEERFSPKVVAAFEAARREQVADASRAGKAGGSRRKAVIAGIAGAAAAAGAVVALGGSGTGTMRIVNARFAAAFIDCPNDSNAVPIAYTVLADVDNDGDTATILAATVIARIEASSEAEVGQTSNRPVAVTPMSLPANRTTTVRLDSTLLCSNDAGGPPRSNDWTARLALTTTTGTINGETVDRLRVNIP